MEKKHECCTPKGQVPRYVDCKGCDKKPIEKMSKQTAVEWYIEQEQILGDKLSEGIIGLSLFNDEVAKLKIQAKQMEKEQIIDAHIHAQFKVIEAKREFAQKYFNDFYGGNNE